MKNSWVFILFTLLISCSDAPIPKPMGYFRVGLPDHKYSIAQIDDCPYSFELNSSARILKKENCWSDVEYPDLKATIQLTYHNFDVYNLEKLIDDGRRMAYSHTKVADGMNERIYINHENSVYGILYEMKGQVATSTQFFMTDSTDNFLRGVLYFYSHPNPDSLRDVNKFMEQEIQHMIETLKWKNG